MMPPEKIKAIRKELRNGVPEGEIKETLKAQGFTSEEISQAFKPHYYDMRGWYLYFGTALLVIGIWMLVQRGSLLLLLLSGGLFYAYAMEVRRQKNMK